MLTITFLLNVVILPVGTDRTTMIALYDKKKYTQAGET